MRFSSPKWDGKWSNLLVCNKTVVDSSLIDFSLILLPLPLPKKLLVSTLYYPIELCKRNKHGYPFFPKREHVVISFFHPKFVLSLRIKDQ